MKVLVVGSGGREHALVWKLRQSPKVTAIFAAPGNPGTAQLAENVAIAATDIMGLVNFAKSEAIDLVIVGPEQPLELGLVDAMQLANLTVFGPTQAAAQLESSKSFAKEIMVAAGVPTAAYQILSNEEAAMEYIGQQSLPLVIKADGLAAGKGVFVCTDRQQAEAAIVELYQHDKQRKVVIEEFLCGQEASLIVACACSMNDSSTNDRSSSCYREIVPLAAAHDYKRIFDDDQGPNTGGMGTVSPTPNMTDEQYQWTLEQVIVPVLAEMNRRQISFNGFLYAGLMIAPDGKLNVLEFNCRLGDPEAQVILKRLESDLFEILYSLATGKVPPQQIDWSANASVCVVLASKGYPHSSSNGDVITGIDRVQQLKLAEVFHAGTDLDQQGRLVTKGGRVLNIVGTGSDLQSARLAAYQATELVSFPGMQLRSDIGAVTKVAATKD